MQILACPDAVKGALLPGGRVRLRVRYPFTPKTSPRVRLWGGSAVALVGVEPPLVGRWARRSSSSSVIEFNEEAVLAIGTRGPTLPDGPREHLFDSTMRGTWSSDHLGLEIAKESCARTAVGSN